jgi:hypothetical protein
MHLIKVHRLEANRKPQVDVAQKLAADVRQAGNETADLAVRHGRQGENKHSSMSGTLAYFILA